MNVSSKANVLNSGYPKATNEWGTKARSQGAPGFVVVRGERFNCFSRSGGGRDFPGVALVKIGCGVAKIRGLGRI